MNGTTMNLLEVDDSSWEQEIELSELPVLVMFSSPTCVHCKEMEPYFIQYAQEYEGKVKFARLNIVESMFTAERYGVMASPTFTFFCKGKPVQNLAGAAYPTLLKKLIDESLQYGEACVGKSTPVRFDPAYA
jgi:thioredoxin 1